MTTTHAIAAYAIGFDPERAAEVEADRLEGEVNAGRMPGWISDYLGLWLLLIKRGMADVAGILELIVDAEKDAIREATETAEFLDYEKLVQRLALIERATKTLGEQRAIIATKLTALTRSSPDDLEPRSNEDRDDPIEDVAIAEAEQAIERTPPSHGSIDAWIAGSGPLSDEARRRSAVRGSILFRLPGRRIAHAMREDLGGVTRSWCSWEGRSDRTIRVAHRELGATTEYGTAVVCRLCAIAVTRRGSR